MKTYLLFDIDGTLVNTGGAGLRAMEAAAAECLGDGDLLAGCSFAGKTDRQIIFDLVRKSGLTDELEATAGTMCMRYVELLQETLPAAENFFVYPHAPEVLERLSKDSELELALLTGNLEQGARMKLEQAGLWHYFAWGVYGDASENRNKLSQKALRLITDKDGPVDSRRIVIIGDTVHDIRCGKAIGAVTIAFAAGFEPPEKLITEHPDYLTADFSELPAILASL